MTVRAMRFVVLGVVVSLALSAWLCLEALERSVVLAASLSEDR